MKTRYLLLIVLIVFLLSGCADVADVKECVTPESYGFWSGLWHGFIIMFSWIGSLFSDDIAIYAVNNNGGWYNFGYIIGLGGFGFSSSKSSK